MDREVVIIDKGRDKDRDRDGYGDGDGDRQTEATIAKQAASLVGWPGKAGRE